MLKKNCRSCDNVNLHNVISLGYSPLANNLLCHEDDIDDLYPLDVMYCNNCYNVQLSYVVPPEKMFDTYLYVSSTTKSFRDHFSNASKQLINELNLSLNSVVVDIGSNDGIALEHFAKEGIKVIGIEPAKNIAKIAIEKGIETINSYFDDNVVKYISEKFGKVDLVTASNVFAHSDGLKQMTKNVFSMLKQAGKFVIEVQYLVDTIRDLTFDNIYHEHVNYWTVTSINNFFKELDLTVTNVEHINTHGGSIRVYVGKKDCVINANVQKFLDEESKFGILTSKTYENFAERILQAKKNVINNLLMLKQKGYKIVGYGSPAKATTALNYFEIGTNYIDYIVEDNSLKHNKLIPGVRIPIKHKSELAINKPDIIVIMAWNFAEEIKKNNKDLIDSGIKFVSIKDLQNSVLE